MLLVDGEEWVDAGQGKTASSRTGRRRGLLLSVLEGEATGDEVYWGR